MNELKRHPEYPMIICSASKDMSLRLWNVENDAEGEDGDDVGGDSLADSAGVCEVPVGVRMADGAVSNKERPGNFICRTGFSRKCFFC